MSLGQIEALRTRHHGLADELPLAVLDCVFNPACNLVTAIDDLCAKAIDLVRGGAAILLLTDRSRTCSRLDSHSHGAGDRGRASCTDSRRGSVLTPAWLSKRAIAAICIMAQCSSGMGAGAVCPWLALETARSVNAEKGEANLLHAFDAGLAKIMSKMGISVVDSYRGAHLFDSIGLEC